MTKNIIDIEQSKQFCNGCGTEKEVLKATTDASGGIINLSCGHKIIFDMAEAVVIVDASIADKHSNKKDKLLSESYRKKSDQQKGVKKQQVHTFDHVKRIRYHSVFEEGPNGEWIKIFGPAPRPFKKKTRAGSRSNLIADKREN